MKYLTIWWISKTQTVFELEDAETINTEEQGILKFRGKMDNGGCFGETAVFTKHIAFYAVSTKKHRNWKIGNAI